MKNRFIIFVAAALGCAAPVLAVLGVGDIVYDPTNYEEAVRQLVQLQQQYSQLVETYHVIENQYDEMLRMALQVPVNMAARYRGLSAPWLAAAASNTYGTTAGWISGANTGLGVASGYAAATRELQTYGPALGNIPSEQLAHVKTDYATVELTDGANLGTLETIGRLRANAPAVETAIQNIENDSLSSDPAMNTEVAVLNKINAAGVMSLRNSRDTNQVLIALAEERLLQAKRERDAEVQTFNEHIRFMAEGQSVMAAQAAQASEAMLAWRMP